MTENTYHAFDEAEAVQQQQAQGRSSHVVKGQMGREESVHVTLQHGG